MVKKTIGLTVKNYDNLKLAAEKRGTSIQRLANVLLEQFDVATDEEKVILKIPKDLSKEDKVGLKSWLAGSMDAILSAYYPEGVECH